MKYPGLLFDVPLKVETMDPDLIGATYLFRDQKNQLYDFSIKARQANDPQEDSQWALWFGRLNDLPVLARVNEVMDYLKGNSAPDIRTHF